MGAKIYSKKKKTKNGESNTRTVLGSVENNILQRGIDSIPPSVLNHSLIIFSGDVKLFY